MNDAIVETRRKLCLLEAQPDQLYARVREFGENGQSGRVPLGPTLRAAQAVAAGIREMIEPESERRCMRCGAVLDPERDSDDCGCKAGL